VSVKEIISLIIKVVSSWQVIVPTVILALYFMLVNYVTRIHHRSAGFSFDSKPKKVKAEKNSPAAAPSGSGDDDLGLEEE
jgi:hypothetical protein